MTEPNDQGQQDPNQDQGVGAGASANNSGGDSGVDWEAKAKHFQSIADQRGADLTKVLEENKTLKTAQEEAATKELQEKEEFKKLYEQEQQKTATLQTENQKALLGLKLRDHVAEKYPEHIADLKWIAPLVDSEESIASVTEDYVKAHPKQVSAGTASLGNAQGGSGDGQITISKADLSDPAKISELLKKYPDLDEKLNSGEIVAI